MNISLDDYNSDGFYKALFVWIQKPQVLNRRLCGSKTVLKFNIQLSISVNHVFTNKNQLVLGIRDWTQSAIQDTLEQITKETAGDRRDIEVIFRDLLPKQAVKYNVVRELILIDKAHYEAVFLPLWYSDKQCEAAEEISYLFSYKPQQGVSVTLSDSKHSADDRLHSCSADWIQTVLLKKLKNWSTQSDLNIAPSTLKLVPVDKYNILYQQLKDRHGKQLVKMWPESTDPQKFVYEDIGIAAYLLLLWEAERDAGLCDHRQTFVDLGCGNGLLVHLLTAEGHTGCGIDLQKRNIWNLYDSDLTLKEMAISPSETHLFPDADWLIGNHSDELTPWIPVIAARSSYKCRYFVLPCCFHDFDGKFSARGKVSSQYQAYLDYIRKIGQVCGFKVHQDALRIPSTKKICLVGQERTYSEIKEDNVEQNRTSFIKSRCKNVPETIDYSSHSTKDVDCNKYDKSCDATSDRKSWAPGFKTREKQEVNKPRNAVTLNSDLKEFILGKVFNKLIELGCDKTDCDIKSADIIDDNNDCSSHQMASNDEHSTTWNTGGKLELADAATLFDKETLQQLKQECGGLQTVLRNCHQAFLVCGGCVQIRNPTDDNHKKPESKHKKTQKQSNKQADRYKVKMCYFYQHHPQGCPLSVTQCQYAHGKTDLRTLNPPKSKQDLTSNHKTDTETKKQRCDKHNSECDNIEQSNCKRIKLL